MAVPLKNFDFKMWGSSTWFVVVVKCLKSISALQLYISYFKDCFFAEDHIAFNIV
ncbi:hypothetical protein SAMN05192545_3403 [Maribacter dokdonensis]|uniref:Uncharacterized protein n=1 Tax=Maribacter dokdonensis TaxID=320912 RepID=A0ABY0UX88_9FLAO|nr:hypothetical protein SAMN05192545_3403 [Maribacter dokdonensis]